MYHKCEKKYIYIVCCRIKTLIPSAHYHELADLIPLVVFFFFLHYGKYSNVSSQMCETIRISTTRQNAALKNQVGAG